MKVSFIFLSILLIFSSCVTPSDHEEAIIGPIMENQAAFDGEGSVSEVPDPEIVEETDPLVVEVVPSEPRPVISEEKLDDVTPEEPVVLHPPLRTDLLVDTSVILLQEGRFPLEIQGRPWGIIHDLDKNGFDDYILLTQDGEASLTTADLMDSRRLFQEDVRYFQFGVSIFYQFSDSVVNRYYIPLSNKLVLQDFRFQEIRKGSDFPYNLIVEFQNHEGTQAEWITLSGRGISRITLDQTLSKTTILRDIDEDGVIDILILQKGYEQGRGWETFISWYFWDGNKFTVRERTNVVRNLQEFFITIEELIFTHGWEYCFPHHFEPTTLASDLVDEENPLSILDLYFKPLEGMEELPLREVETVSVDLPSILEDPFSYEPGQSVKFSFILKVLDDLGGAHFYRGTLGMSPNPFDDSQFYFLPQ